MHIYTQFYDEAYVTMISLQVNPSDVIILEGILVFHDPRVRELMNMKIFVDTGPFVSINSEFIILYVSHSICQYICNLLLE